MLLQRLHGNIDAESFDKAIATLDQSGFVTMNGINIPEYKLSQKGRELILGEVNGKVK
jgi:hypothetical protein